MSFLMSFGTGAADAVTSDLQNKREIRQKLVAESAAALRGKLDSAVASRSKKKSAYESAYKLAQENNVPFSVIDGVIARTSDITKLGEFSSEAINNYKKALNDPAYRMQRHGQQEMESIFPANPEGASYTSMAEGSMGQPGEMPVEGGTGGAFSTDPSAGYNKALIRLAQERGLSPEQAAGLIYEFENPAQGSKYIAPEYGDVPDVPGGVSGSESAKNASPFVMRKPKPGGGYSYATIDKTIGPEEFKKEFDRLERAGYGPTDLSPADFMGGMMVSTLQNRSGGPRNDSDTLPEDESTNPRTTGEPEAPAVNDVKATDPSYPTVVANPSVAANAKRAGISPEEYVDRLIENGTYEEAKKRLGLQ